MEYILKKELKNINFQTLSAIRQNACVCGAAIMSATKILKWKNVKSFIIFLIYSDIKLSSGITFVDHIKDDIKSFT